MSNPLDAAPEDGPRLRDHSPVFTWIAKIDDGLYAVERGVVTAAMLLMSGVVCLAIFAQFLQAQRGVIRGMGENSTASDLVPMAAIVVAGVLLFRACWAHSPALKDNPLIVWVMTGLTTLAVAMLGYLMLAWSSSTICALMMGLIGLVMLGVEADRPVPLDAPPFGGMLYARLAAVLLFSIGGVYFALKVPEGYSWAQKFALFLLLWVAFIGASMATHDKRHLSIDAVRKAVPRSIAPYYNALSYLVAAVFTGAFMYLSYTYFQLRADDTPTPGEIPDWLKVLSIPFSLALVTARFLGQSIGSLLFGVLGLNKESGTSEEAPAT